MKADVFITKYNVKMKHIINITDGIIMDTVKSIARPVEYIPFDDKLKIIDKTFSDSKGSDHIIAERYRCFIINLISTYTDIECDKHGFDVLCQNKMVDVILATFKSEYEICSNLLQMCSPEMERR